MSHHLVDGGKLLLEPDDKLCHRLLLSLSASVRYDSIFIEPTLVTNAYGMCIPTSGMAAYTLQRPGQLNSTITSDIIVIPDVSHPSQFHMVVIEILHCKRVIAACG